MRLVGVQAPFIRAQSKDTNAGAVIGPLWGRLHEHLDRIAREDPATLYGYSCFGVPTRRTHPDEVLYLAGARVAPGGDVPDGLDVVETAAGMYAIFEHRGPIWHLGETVRAIYRDWLPGSGYRGNGRGDVEVYDERWSADGADSVLEYWVGVERAAGGSSHPRA